METHENLCRSLSFHYLIVSPRYLTPCEIMSPMLSGMDSQAQTAQGSNKAWSHTHKNLLSEAEHEWLSLFLPQTELFMRREVCKVVAFAAALDAALVRGTVA